MKKSIKFLPLLATGLLAVGCQDYDAGFTEADIKTKQYADKFVQEFGQVDPNQDWSMATLVEANVNLPELQGTAKMNIMTGDPRLSSTRLLAQIMLENGKGQIQFDAIKGQKNVFITVKQDDEYKIYAEYPVVNGIVTVGKNLPTTRAFASSCPSSVSDIKTGLFTNIDSNVKKYKWNDKYYSIDELRAWATEQATTGTVTWENYGTTTPFNDDCALRIDDVVSIRGGR